MKPDEHKWENVLWKSQGYEDNYVDPKSFLESLKKNPNFRPYTYWPLVFLTCAITQHIASIFIFLAVFLHLREGWLNPRGLLWASMGAFCVGYGCWTFLSYKRTKDHPGSRETSVQTHLKTLKSSILVFLSLMSLSPVLRTLTAATSSDSIWAMSAILFMLNVLLADYSVMPTNEHGRERLSSVLSMNAAISGSVVLASRLSTFMSVFTLVLCSVVAFAFFPMLRRLIQGTSGLVWIAQTILLSVSAVTLAACVSNTFMYLGFATLFVVTFVAPAMLVWAQKFKNEIRGPWDAAIPIIH